MFPHWLFNKIYKGCCFFQCSFTGPTAIRKQIPVWSNWLWTRTHIRIIQLSICLEFVNQIWYLQYSPNCSGPVKVRATKNDRTCLTINGCCHATIRVTQTQSITRTISQGGNIKNLFACKYFIYFNCCDKIIHGNGSTESWHAKWNLIYYLYPPILNIDLLLLFNALAETSIFL